MTDETQKAIELLDKLAILAEKYTPQVYQTAVNVVQIQAMGKLCLSALFLLVLYFSCQKILKLHKQGFFDDKDEAACVISCIFGISAALVTGAYSLANLFDVWNWVALFKPDLALAYKILNI